MDIMDHWLTNRSVYKEKTILLVQYSAIAKVISTMISENKTM